MNKSELKDLVKRYFNLTEINNTEDTITEKFTQAKLADGTVITNMVDADFEVGQELHVITEDGEHVLAPSGEHTTESGIVITVDENGVITGVKHPDQEGEGSLEAPAEEAMSSEETTELAEEEIEVEVAPEEISDVKEAIIEAIAEVVGPQLEEMKSKLAEMEEKMNSAFSSTPASNPTMEAKFSKENKSELDFLNKKFDFKQAQLESILSRNKKK